MRAHRMLIAGAFILAALTQCDPSVPPGRIQIKNDSQDSEYNVVQISGGGSSFSLKPGEYHLLPQGTTSISFSRAYKDYVRRYQVSCPGDLTDGITIKLIDVHLNRIAGGCKTVYSNMK